MANLAVTLGNAIINATPKVARRAKYLMQEVTPCVSAFERSTTVAARKAKYLQEPVQSTMSACECLSEQNKTVTKRRY